MIALREAVRRVLAGSTPAAPASDNRISWEIVQSVTGMNECVVLGHTLPVTGLAAFPVGARVPVAWKNGTPVAVIGHRTRRAQFHPSRRTDTKGIVEELVVGNFDGTLPTVWYRNQDRLEQVVDADGTPVSSLLRGVTPQQIKWGLDGKSFAVACSSGWWATFALDRDDANVLDPIAPGHARLLWMGRQAEFDAPMVTVTYRKRVTKKIVQWIGQRISFISYRAVQSRTGWWVWDSVFNVPYQGWEGEVSGEGAASVGTSKVFNLKALLAGTIRDWYGDPKVSIEELDWYLDNDRRLKFVYRVDWHYFWVGDNQTGTGTVPIPHAPVRLPDGTSGWGTGSETISVGGQGVGCLGAKRRSDLQTVPESHIFIVVPETASVEWASCPQSVTMGTDQHRFGSQLLEHVLHDEPSYPAGLPQPHWPDWDPPNPPGTPRKTDGYYGGANWSNLPLTIYRKDAGLVGDESTRVYSSTGTYQLFDATRLAALVGPYGEENTAEYSSSLSIIGSWTANYIVTFSIRTGGVRQLWHHRMVTAQVFSRRYVATVQGGGVLGTGIDEPLLFLVMEKYPYISGTGYINDLPMTWVGIVTVGGQVVATLRPWQYGLSGSACRLVAGNGHRLIWVLGVGAISPIQRYYSTNLDTGAEVSLNSTEVAALLASRSLMLTPDFVWERQDPQGFYALESLPTLTPDDVLTEYASLLAVEGAPEGSVRVVNDEAILSPLDRYRTT